MRVRALAIGFSFALVIFAGSSVCAADAELDACNVCICTSGEVVCLDTIDEVLEGQAICNVACAEIGSSHGSREFIDAPCDELPQCGNVGAPAAGPLWLSLGALGLLGLGGWTLKRARRRTNA
jgi:hypothetical protein